MTSLAERLDLLAAVFSSRRFGFGSNLDEFTFQVSREGLSVVFRNKDMEVRIGGFKLMAPSDWHKKEPKATPVINEEQLIRNLWYKADVGFSIGKIKGSMRLPLGYATYRDALTAPLGTMPERVIINDLLFEVERWLASTFGDEFLSPQVSKNAVRDRDSHSDSLGRKIIRALGL